ncbi:MAG: polysaccharide pyruvyl transferase CsaB [Candidatus Xenobia bacterium]
MSSPSVVISGYYGFGNAGDEAILTSMVDSLRRCMPGIRITVMSHNPEQTSRRLGVTSLRRRDLPALLREILRSSLFISGGGGLIQDTTGVNTIRYYLGLVKLARLLRRPVMFYAQGVGPIATEQGREITRKIANTVQYITVRDEESRDLLAACGVTKPPIEVTADPVFIHEPAPPGAIAAVMKQEGLPTDVPLLGVSLRSWHAPPTPVETVREALVELTERLGCHAAIFPFQHSQDLKLCETLAAGLPERFHVVRGEYDTPRLQGLIGRMAVVVGMRLHALIFAATMAVPMVGLVYDPKVRQFLRLIGQPGIELADVTKETVQREVRAAWEERDARQAAIQAVLPGLQEKSRENTRRVCRLIRGVSANEPCCVE